MKDPERGKLTIVDSPVLVLNEGGWSSLTYLTTQSNCQQIAWRATRTSRFLRKHTKCKITKNINKSLGAAGKRGEPTNRHKVTRSLCVGQVKGHWNAPTLLLRPEKWHFTALLASCLCSTPLFLSKLSRFGEAWIWWFFALYEY